MKKSVAYDHFPQVVHQNNRFWLYNPVLKKRYKNRPEERVRLQWVEYLMLQTDWKKSRIGFETPVKLRQSENTLRADLVLYSDSMNPCTIIECKSDTVKLNHPVAVQAARYNQQVNANHLVLTNGIVDYWFIQTDGTIEESSNFLDEETTFTHTERDHNYWYHRGFCSSDINTELKNRLIQSINLFWSDELKGKRFYLDFKETLLPVPMNQYYKLFDIDADKRLALSFIGTGISDNYLVGILSVNRANRAMVSVNLSKVEAAKKKAIFLFENGEKSDITSTIKNTDAFFPAGSADVDKLPKIFMKFFD